jgi:hypothetical protein
VQIERPDLRVVEGARTGASMFDVVTRPQCGEALALDAELADEFDKFAIGGSAPSTARKNGTILVVNFSQSR